MKKILAILFIVVLAFPMLPVQAAKVVPGPGVNDPPDNLVPSSAVQKTSFVPHFVGNGPVIDKGKITYLTTLTGFTWNVSKSQSLTLGVPSLVMATSVASLTVPSIYSNATTTQYRFSGFANSMSSSNYFIAVSFTPQGYSTKVSIDGSVGAATVLRLPFTAVNATIVQSSFIPKGSITRTLMPQIVAGNQIFDWTDVPSTFSPTWNSVSNTLSISLTGVFHIDPLAVDGSARNHSTTGTSLTCTLSTASSPDVIIVFARALSGDTDLSSVSDTSSLTWHDRVHVAASGSAQFAAEWWAAASGTLSSDVITVNWPSTGTFNDVTCFGISGANTGSPFDTNTANPSTCTNAANSCTGPAGGNILASVATNNANDIVIGWGLGNAAASPSAGGVFTSIQCANGNFNCAEYDILSATTTSLTLDFGGASMYYSLADSIVEASAGVSQGIKITTANSAPSATITIAGCAVSNGTFTANGNVKHYTGMTASCTVTLTEPTDGSNTRYRFNGWVHPNPVTSSTFKTCGSGTCSEYDNTTYYQLKNTYYETCQTPNNCDGQYSGRSNGVAPSISYNTLSGYWLGTLVNGKPDLCTVQGTNVQMQAQQAIGSQSGRCFDTNTLTPVAAIWVDYNMVVTFPALIGNTWNAQGNHSFSDTTAGNTHTVNYVQAIAGDPANFLWLLAIPLLGFVFLILRRR